MRPKSFEDAKITHNDRIHINHNLYEAPSHKPKSRISEHFHLETSNFSKPILKHFILIMANKWILLPILSLFWWLSHLLLNLARLITMFVFLSFWIFLWNDIAALSRLSSKGKTHWLEAQLWFCDDCDKNWGDVLFPPYTHMIEIIIYVTNQIKFCFEVVEKLTMKGQK